MPRYVVLYKFTEQGMKNMADCSQRVQLNKQRWEELGGKLLGHYLTLGEYDAVSIVEAPNDQVGLQFLIEQGIGGDVRATSLRAFGEDEFGEVIKNLRPNWNRKS